MTVLRVDALPDAAVAAAAQFYRDILPKVAATFISQRLQLTLVFSGADHTHRAWRLAAIQALAREHAPMRVNAVSSDSESAIAAALSFLASAEGITGQVLELDDTGAGEVVASAS